MSRRLVISSPGRRLLLKGAIHPRALLPALAFALFCAHLPANVFAGERATSISLPSFTMDSGNAGGSSAGTRKDDKDKNEKKDKDKDRDKDNDDADVEPGVPPAVPSNGAELTISGTSAATIVALDRYSFRPTTAGGVGDSVLAFSISGEPLWAVFNELTGELSGTPEEADVGLYQAITISVTDGSSDVSLVPFSIEVTAIGTAIGSVTLSWIPPTENEDGTPLVDLAGYRVYWGQSPGTHTEVVNFDNPGLSRVVIDNVPPGTYEFVATSLNGAGVESRFSNAITKIVQ